ncbi:MAG TPA: haloalkane dehalogenase [Gemmataceae bacterium]|jgi:haloalkane dehalogenase
MRKLTKTMVRFSWSMSMFGLQQLANLLIPGRAARAFDNASRSMAGELAEPLRTAFRAGDALQSGMIDLMFGGVPAASPNRLTPPPPPPPDAAWADDPVAQARTPTPAAQRGTGGWGPMPFPVIPPQSGPARGPEPAAGPGPETDISPDYPFEPHYVQVRGSRMHYIDVGSGDPILLLHGNPTWSYLWRNVIPHLEPLGRCIAPDLIGYGRSDKPAIDYRWFDHVRYLEGFIDKLRLKNITLVLHDQGSGLGFHYAMRHEGNIKALAFFEAILRPYPWDHFSTPEFRELFRRFRTGGVGGEGWQLIVDQNAFIEQLLPQAAGRPLTEQEMNYYREPFRNPKSRLPIWRFPRETPIGGEPPDVWRAVAHYSERLQRSTLPKLLLYATPGALVTAEHLDWAKKSIRNLQTVSLGAGSHFLQESSPHRIGTEVARWIRTLPGNRGRCGAGGAA